MAQRNLDPVHPKVTAATLGVAVAAVIFGGVDWLTTLPSPPGGVEAAVATLFAAVFGWMRPDQRPRGDE